MNQLDSDYVAGLSDRCKKSGFLKSVKGELAVVLQDDLVVRLIEDIILGAGGWNVPYYVDVPENFRAGIELPLAAGSVTVESFGHGELFNVDGLLFKSGYRARVQYRAIGYRCTVIDSNSFEVWKSDRANWTGTSPDNAWVHADKHFGADGWDLFGLTNPIVQFEYGRELQEGEIEGYSRPKVIFYQTEAPVVPRPRRRVARPRQAAGARTQKGPTRNRRLEDTTSEDESDEMSETPSD
jgi:hypothetical protein